MISSALASCFRLRSVVLLLLGIPVGVGLLWPEPIPWWEAALGAALVIAGVGLRLASARWIGKYARQRQCRPKRLVTGGPFGRCRNPLYVANLLLLEGLSVLAGAKLLAAGAFVAGWLFYTLVALHEEEQLAESFGEPYLIYRERVPRWLPRPGAELPGPGGAPFTWSEVLWRERGLLPGSGLGLVGIFLARTGVLPFRTVWEQVAGLVALPGWALLVVVVLLSAAVHGLHSEYHRRRLTRRREDSADVAAPEQTLR